MRIDGLNPGVGALRLVHPPVSQHSFVSALPKSAARNADGDSVTFESIYISRLPRVPMTEAHRRLERVREQLVAGRTGVPIHFYQAVVSRPPGLAAGSYGSLMRIQPHPADVNIAATERRSP